MPETSQLFSPDDRQAIKDRVALCKKFVEAFQAMGDQVATEITVQMGKPLSQAKGEIDRMVERAEHMMDIAPQVLADEPAPEAAGFKKYIRHEPLGVVFDVAAWNYPLLIAVNVVVPSVLAGNAVILKHSSKTPLCGQAFEDAHQHRSVNLAVSIGPMFHQQVHTLLDASCIPGRVLGILTVQLATKQQTSHSET